MVRSFRDLIAWQKAMTLAESVYLTTRAFHVEERFGLTSQLRRSAVSIASNIAEGNGRLTTRDWQHFLSQARGSAQELETQLILAQRLGFGDQAHLQSALSDVEEVGRIINGLLQASRSRAARKSLESS